MAEGPIVRTLRILEALCLHGPQSLTELCERVDLTGPTTLRFLRLMQTEGYVKQNENRQWSATLRMWRLGAAVVDGQGWSSSMNNALSSARDEIGETVVYASYDDGMTVYLGSAEPRQELRTHVTLGSTRPAHETLTGRCILAFQAPEHVDEVMERQLGAKWTASRRQTLLDELAEIRTTSAAIGRGETFGGLWGAAVPVRSRSGEVTAAIGTAMPSGRQPENSDALVAALHRAAEQVVGL